MPWRQTVAWAARDAQPGAPLEGPLEVDLVFTMPRPKNLPRDRKGYPACKPDLDKLARAVLDALTDAGAWKDDAQVVKLAVEETYGPHDRALDKPGVIGMVKELAPWPA